MYFHAYVSIMQDLEDKWLGDMNVDHGIILEQRINGWLTLRENATIHQVTNMLATSKNVLFPGSNHLAGAGAIIKVLGHQHRCLAGG